MPNHFRYLLLTSTLILPFSCRTVNNSDIKFGAGEHQLLGNAGFQNACPTCPEIDAGLTTKNGGVNLSYGQIVAFSGDFYGDPRQLDEEPVVKFLGFKTRDPEAAKKLFAQEVEDIQAQLKDDTKDIADNNNAYLKEFTTDYLELAANNSSHFGWHNMKAYVEHHAKALQLAVESHATQDARSKAELRRKALLTNGFADHFLTDGFAAGHVRVPRQETIDWAENGIGSYFATRNKAAAGILSKVLHDGDHRYVSGKAQGLRVRNARGDSWATRSDGDLYRGAGDNPTSMDHIRLPIEAVAISVQEVLTALETGRTPEGIYAATRLVPFIDPKEKKLIEAFPANMDDDVLNEVISQAGIPQLGNSAAGLTQDAAKKYFNDLPTIMENFQKNVANDMKKQPELSLRLPKAYRDGFLNVQ